MTKDTSAMTFGFEGESDNSHLYRTVENIEPVTDEELKKVSGELIKKNHWIYEELAK